MQQVTNALAKLIGVIFIALALIIVVSQLIDGTPLSEVEWILPLCLGLPGIIIAGSAFILYDINQDAASTEEHEENNEEASISDSDGDADSV